MADTFYNAIRQDLIMIKNDTMQFGFQIVGLKGATPSQITFTVKSSPDDNNYIFQKSLNKGVFLREYDEVNDVLTYGVRIAPQDTETAAAGRYHYDLQVDVNADVLTLMKGRFTIEYEVTSGQAPEPKPDYENGDEVQYPIDDAPIGTVKLYTEEYINELIRMLQQINDSEEPITTSDAVAVAEQINQQIIEVSEAINTVYGTPSAPDIPLSQMANSINIIGDNIIPCLCSTNAQSILLPVYGNEDLVFKFKLLRTSTEYYTAIVAGTWGTWNFLFHTNQNNTYIYYTGSNSTVTIPAKIWEWQEVELGSGYAIVDGVTYTGGSGTRNADQIRMFGIPNYYSNVAIGETEIYKDGNLIMRLVPKEDEDGHGYFHDEINDIDYYSTTDTHLIYKEIKV